MRSVHALQQAMVRMLLDPVFATAVQSGPVPELTEAERSLLTAVDPRAWSTDGYRRGRAVHALIDEYPATTWILGVPGVDAFFSSDAFGRCLASRGSLALDFGSWAPAGELAQLERAIALARRREQAVGCGILTRPGLVPIRIGAGTLAAYSAIRDHLGPDPVAALAQHHHGQPIPDPGPPEPLLIESADDGAVALSGASEALVDLLLATSTPTSRAHTEARACELGCDPTEAAELVDGLLADGSLIAIEAETHPQT